MFFWACSIIQSLSIIIFLLFSIAFYFEQCQRNLQEIHTKCLSLAENIIFNEWYEDGNFQNAIFFLKSLTSQFLQSYIYGSFEVWPIRPQIITLECLQFKHGTNNISKY